VREPVPLRIRMPCVQQRASLRLSQMAGRIAVAIV
jgi:hypothetical protein